MSPSSPPLPARTTSKRRSPRQAVPTDCQRDWPGRPFPAITTLTSRERYEYDRARTKREVERVETALKTKVAEGRYRSTAARTVADLVERWYRWR
jgi:hypothetical protein